MAVAISTSSKSRTVAAATGFRGRTLERTLLLWNAPLVAVAAWGVALTQRHPTEAWLPALLALGSIWLACAALHLLLCVTRFDGDLVILPLFSLLLLVGATYQVGVKGLAGGLTPVPYTRAALLALAVLALLTTAGPWFKRISILLEEKVWWRVARDRPYYESAPFHVLLFGLMILMALLLLFRGLRAENGAVIQVRLPGGLQFTPSEVIRLAVAFFLADYLGRNSRLLRNLREPVGRIWPLNRIYMEKRTELVVLLTTILLYCLFFYAFRDFGPAAVIIALTLAALYASTGRLLTPLLIGLGLTLLIAIPTYQDLAFHTFRNRAEMWLNPWDTDFVNGDHQARILWSIAAGGWYGMGVGNFNLSQTLPLARNDAAFAGVAAALGMWVALALLGLFAALTWRGMLAARQAPTDRMRLLAFCLTSLLAFQAIWICGAMVRVFPFTGINVPFISTGLTSMLCSAVALGTVWNISRLGAGRVGGTDATEASPEVLRGVTRMARPVTWAFALPAAGLVLYGCPWLLGDRTLVRSARGMDRSRSKTLFPNPYLERFKQRFDRGRVFSADGRLLAVSRPTAEEVAAIRETSPRFVDKITPEKIENGQRFYPLGADAAQLVGWTPQGRFMALQGSVETVWDPLLRGYKPEQLPFYFRTRHNPVIRPPQPQDLQLTIQADLQQYAVERLARAVKDWDGSGGAAVVYDATTGEVLAAATAPTFDPNGLTLERMQRYTKENTKTQVLLNKALSREALYFPGSTFKILTAGAALEEGVDGGITCRNGHNAEAIRWEYAGTRWRRDPGKISDYSRGSHGAMDLAGSLDRALTVSCNVFFAKLAAELGPEAFHDALERAELTRIPDARQLAEHLPYNGFGQIDVKASPLEMAMLAGAAGMALEGLPDASTARPHWVKAVVTRQGPREPDGLPGAPNRKPYRPFKPEVAQRLREMLVRVVEDPGGTAHSAFYFPNGERRLDGITVGGKTGTAEFEKTVSGRRRPALGRHAWFVGFARSDHELQPRTLAFAVLVEDVRRGGTGGQVCAPVARDLVAKILPPPGEPAPGIFRGLERFYPDVLRPRLGPLQPLGDWLNRTFQRR